MMSKFDKLYKAISDKKTILGVGPMSWNCIDVVIDTANKYKIPIQLIASRRQVECKGLGGGYVTDTETLANYVKERDKGEYVFLARDHGGPWQGTKESGLTYGEAIRRAKFSYEADIKSGFDILHIDPSLKARPMEEILNDVKVLYEYCEMEAFRNKKDLIYEVGTEEHSGQITTLAAFESFVKQMQDLEKVRFVVGNMGLYVKEVENIGKYDSEQAKALVEICNENSLYLKGHNTDYCGDSVLALKNLHGVHSINVAPQFGVTETVAVLAYLDEKKRKEFVKIAKNSGKWKKWMKLTTLANDKIDPEYLAMICGHYVFNDPRVIELRKSIDEEKVKATLTRLLERYLLDLQWSLL
jgi:tagatose-1,6-bisphosphate aldolase non-catalytic subunit AgaZ/GatZ